MRSLVLVLAVGIGLIACGKANSPADAIALGHTRTCDDAGVWDGLECATPHVQEAEDVPVEARRKPASSWRKTPQPPRQECNCQPADPLCSCDEDDP